MLLLRCCACGHAKWHICQLGGRHAGFDKIKIQWQFSRNVISRGYANSGSLVHCWLVHGVLSSIYYLTGILPCAHATPIKSTVCWVLLTPSQERWHYSWYGLKSHYCINEIIRTVLICQVPDHSKGVKNLCVNVYRRHDSLIDVDLTKTCIKDSVY